MTHLILIQTDQTFTYRQIPNPPDQVTRDVKMVGALPDYIKADDPPGKPYVKYAAHSWNDWVVLIPVEIFNDGNNPERLTRRQLDVLIGLSQGLTGKQIAGRLKISRRSVSLHVAGIKSCLSASTQAECVQKATRLGIINRVEK